MRNLWTTDFVVLVYVHYILQGCISTLEKGHVLCIVFSFAAVFVVKSNEHGQVLEY